MEIAILGPLQVRVDGEVVPPGGPKQRTLLAMLALHANEVVARDRLIDALWAERPPASVDQSLDTYVSRLRRALGRDRLLRQAGGYVLRLEAGELDLERFERLVGAASDCPPEQAVPLLREALALWRGQPLSDVLYEPFADGELDSLEERRLEALERLFDAELASGRGTELVAELEPLVRRHPLRERLLGQLMHALYRAGRQADALAFLQEARHRLAHELGIAPGPQLSKLEGQILRHDPSLDPKVRPRRERRRRWAVAAGAVAAAILAATTTAAIVGSGDRTPPLEAGNGQSRLVALATTSGRPTGAIELQGPPAALAAGAGSLWTVDPSGQAVTRVDPGSGSVVDRIAVGGEPGSLVWGGDSVWVATTIGATIVRIDPETSSVTERVELAGANATAIASGRDGIWVAEATDRALVEIDPRTGAIRRRLTLDVRPSAVAVSRRGIWVAGYDEGIVEEVDPGSGLPVTTVRVGQGPSALALDGDAVWVANSLDSTVSRIDATRGAVAATIPVGSGASALSVAGGSIWVANTYSGSVSRVDPAENRVVATLPVDGQPTSLAAHRGELWVGTAPRGDRHRGGTLTLVQAAPFPSIDPGLHETGVLLPRLVYDSLVGFQARSGPAGLRLVPDLALAVPMPTRHGRTYAFRLRPGIRYSDGRPVRPRDFRRAIERLFRLDSPGASSFESIVGAPRCIEQPARCRLRHGIVVDDEAATVVIHLREPDPDFLYKLTVGGFSAPIPPGVPDRDVGGDAIPGTGPYQIAHSDAHGLRLTRNPFFHEWSHAAQPDGNPDEVVWRYTGSARRSAHAVDAGRADWVGALIPSHRLDDLRLRDPARIRRNPSFAVGFIPLNTRRRPFDDARVRRALNLAIDRTRIARMYAPSGIAAPTCQPLPPGFRGYRRYCPYTAEPRDGGRWAAPDLARARRLVTASGTRGERVDVWGVTDLPYVPRQLPAYIAGVLRSLGYRTSMKLVPYASYTPALRSRLQLTVDGDWVPDYPSPSSYLTPFFSCSGSHNRRQYVCDPHLDARLRQASALELQDPSRAAAAWAAIDHELVDRAYWVPTVNVDAIEVVSSRLRNYQYHPVWGFLAAQAWLAR